MIKEVIKEKIRNITVKHISIGIVVVIAIGGIYIGSEFIGSGTNPFTGELVVNTPSEKGDKLDTPYSLSEESFDKLLKSDSYLSNYNLKENYQEDLSNVGNDDNFRYSRQTELYGTYNDNTFYGNIKTYNNFTKPTSITLTFIYTDANDRSKINNAIDNIITKQFNSDISSRLSKLSDDNGLYTVESKDNSYRVRLSKNVEKSDKTNQLVVNIEYNQIINENYGLENVQYSDKLNVLYNNINNFNADSIVETVNNLNSLSGEQNTSKLIYLVNRKETLDKGERDMSSMTVQTTHTDGNNTNLVTNIIKNVDGVSIDISTSTGYAESGYDALQDSGRYVYGLLGDMEEVTEEEVNNGQYTRSGTMKIDGEDITVKAKSVVLTENGKNYAYININNLQEEEEGNQGETSVIDFEGAKSEVN